ncbi:MAG: LamG-like jellyroll fold domain-containing protein [Roseibacillus sp.]
MKADELTQLIDSVLDGDCSEADFLKLEAQLHVDPQARRIYYQRLQLHDGLTTEALESHRPSDSELPSITHLTTKRSPDWGNHQRIWILGGTLATAAAIAIGFFMDPNRNQPSSENNVVIDEPVATGFGVLAESSNAVWADRTIQRGDLIPTGPLKLKSGLAKLELFSGVEIVIEGEAEFELQSAMAMTVHRGKLQADVPEPAHGFRVLTSTGEVVDLGTRFAMNVTPDHNDLQVLEGEIEWHPKSAQKANLLDGDKLRWTAAGKQAETPNDFDLFEDTLDFDRNRDTRRQAWQQQSEVLRHDPHLLAYYAMESTGTRTLPDNSSQENNGTIVRASRSSNRWGQSDRGLDFSPTGSRVRLNVPGTHQALTLFCWVRIDSLDRHYNSLFLTDGHEINEPHWQILDDGRLFFSVKKHDHKSPHKHIAYSPPIWTPAQSGQWLQIATVYDSSAGTTTHYLNGEQISQDQLAPELIVPQVSIGAASIGNWSEPYSQDPDFAVRNLNGAIDEFALFSTPLTSDEIKNLYETGKP